MGSHQPFLDLKGLLWRTLAGAAYGAPGILTDPKYGKSRPEAGRRAAVGMLCHQNVKRPRQRRRGWQNLARSAVAVANIWLLLLFLALVGLVGCGSSASPTSSSEAQAVATAERTFLTDWRRANLLAIQRCAGMKGLEGVKCSQAVTQPRQGPATADFLKAFEAILAGGVGPKCEEALEDALYSVTSVPAFGGATTSVCLIESRRSG